MSILTDVQPGVPTLTVDLLRDLAPNGPTDPIAYYKRPLIGRLFRERINLGLRMIADRHYGRALEIGYGAGAVLRAISPLVERLHGIDLDADPTVAQTWLSRHGRQAQLMRASVYEMPYKSEQFDLALSFSVFEHLHRYERGLLEIARVLKPSGRLLLGMPAVNAMMELGFRAIGFKGIDDYHVTTPRAVAGAFDRVGFRVLRDARLRPLPGISLYFNWLLEKTS